MNFEWDEEKNQKNIAKHGLSFEQAIEIFNGFTADIPDERFNYGEKRVISLGIFEDIITLAVVHTDRNGVCRIISARQANKKEHKYYEEALQEAFNS